ncbi:hypothetical protein PAXRUDRAFT_19030 [Paxillus rubicundulus Ve08.2h10]|uniref:Uncharacterized protein n=1 Tax=Paxillus rubicundulus Ve08.2h10 TaxID=930991 RepID=A0A0D0BVK3_9AGAM|nr:hypothetical protein PAXRUDRAFT_19030 [Paxillus rubicundulus Ve08.2h10]
MDHSPMDEILDSMEWEALQHPQLVGQIGISANTGSQTSSSLKPRSIVLTKRSPSYSLLMAMIPMKQGRSNRLSISITLL